MENETQYTIIIPAYNEEEAISGFLDELKTTMEKTNVTYEILVIDDGSTDKTIEIVKKKKKVKLLEHPYNKGYGAAIKTGIKNAEGGNIIILDADGTYSATDIPRLLEFVDEYDMVVGARTGKETHIPLTRKPGKLILSLLANYLTGKKIPDLNSGMRIFRKKAVLKFYDIFPSGFSFTTTITLAYLVNEYTVKYVPINYYRRKGESKINVVSDGLGFILLILRTITYFNPLKIFLPIGALLFLSAVGISLFGFFVLNIVLDVTIAILIFASLQSILLGLLADLIVKRGSKFDEER